MLRTVLPWMLSIVLFGCFFGWGTKLVQINKMSFLTFFSSFFVYPFRLRCYGNTLWQKNPPKPFENQPAPWQRMFTQCRHFYKQQVQSNANKCSSFTILLSFFTYCYTLLGDIIQYGKTMKQNHFQGFFGGGKLFYHFPLLGKKKRKVFPHRFEPRTSRTRATHDNH